jgi:hypothetical protein
MNDEVDNTLNQSKIDLREFENQLFEIKTKQEIVVAPLREYIEDWLKNTLIRINEPKNQETITMIMPLQPQHTPIKESTSSK